MLMEVMTMETKNIILKLRTERGMSQDELADQLSGLSQKRIDGDIKFFR